MNPGHDSRTGHSPKEPPTMDTLRTMLAEPRSGTAAGPTVLVVGDTYVTSTAASSARATVEAT